MTSKEPTDSLQRIQAVDVSHSCLCEAPAGSGKTALLTERILRLLCRVDTPEAILALTFTRKAAAEMRHRVLDTLRLASEKKTSENAYQLKILTLARAVLERDQALQWHLLDNPGRLYISTFDSFCASMTKSLPLQASLGFNIQVTEDPLPIYEAAAQNLLGKLNGLGRSEALTPLCEDIALLLGHVDNRQDVLEKLLVDLIAKRDVWMPLLDYGADAHARYLNLIDLLEDVLELKVIQLCSLMEPDLRAELFQLAEFATQQLKHAQPDHAMVTCGFFDNANNLENCASSAQFWQVMTAFLLTAQGDLRKTVNVKNGFPPGTNKEEKTFFRSQKQRMLELLGKLSDTSELVEAITAIRYWPEPNIDDAQHEVLEALLRLLPYLLVELQLLFSAKKQVDFIEVAARAREALGNSEQPTELLLQMDRRIDHILVDEFQDTSFHQSALLRLLTAGWSADDGRTLFCVGDAMQSIYGFRGANVGLFLQAKQYGIGDLQLAPVQLTTNFRSDAVIVNWVNRVFYKVFPQRNDIASGAVPFSSAIPFLEPASRAKVCTTFFDSEQYKRDEARYIVDLIIEEKRLDPGLSIAVLVRNRKHATEISQLLRVNQVGFTALDLEPLAERAVIKDLVILTKALISPLDRITWLACLRAPWCGLTLCDLEQVANQGDVPQEALVIDQIEAVLSQPNTLSEDGHARLRQFYDTVDLGLETAFRKSFRDWVYGVWVALGGLQIANADEQSNIEAYFDMLQTLAAKKNQVTPDDIDHALGKLYARPGPEDDSSIQIMTMHKAKGLEFDLVILPGLHHRGRHADQDLMLWYEHVDKAGREQVFFAPISAAGAERDKNYQFVHHEQQKKASLELARLFYVACTRAKTKLVLCGHVQMDDASENIKAPSNGSLLAIIWPFLTETERRLSELSVESEQEEGAAEIGAAPTKPLMRVPSSYKPPTEKAHSLLEAFILDRDFDNTLLTAESERDADKQSRWLGTAVHRALEFAMKFDQADLVRGYDPIFWQHFLQKLGASVIESMELQAQHASTLEKVNSHECWRWLQQNRLQTRVEYPLATRSGTCIPDLLVMEQGIVWIVDYKTASRPDEISEKTFSTQVRSTYADDMTRYRNCLHQLGYKDVKCALFLVNEGLWLEYP